MIREEEDFDPRKAKQVFLLDSTQVEYYWEEIVRGLEKSPGFYDYFTPEWAYERAIMGQLQVWALSDGKIRAIVLTQVLEYPRKKVLEILAAYGVGLLPFMNEMQTTFEKFATIMGCTTFSTSARPGLARLLKKNFAAEEICHVLRREVRQQKEQ